MEADRIEAALAALDPEARALVELSLIRDVADDDIASILATDVGEVRIRRADALVLLAVDLGAASGEEVGALMHDMRELPGVRWRDEGERRPVPVPPPAPPAVPAPPEPGPERRSRLRPAILGGILLAAVVALILALAGGGDDDGADGVEQAAEPSAPVSGKRAKLAPLAGGKGEGNVEVNGDRLELSVSGLPDPGGAGYVVWLYSSLSEARPLSGPQSKTAFELTTALPQGAERYRFIDVSLEPADSNRNHSGQSVLRLPLSGLR